MVLFTALVVAGCSGEQSNPILDGSRAFHDAAGTSYTFTYTVESDEWDGSNPITVVVKNDEIIEATDANGVEPEGAFTVRDFYARAERVAGTGGFIEHVVDPEWSYPALLRLDRLPDETEDDRIIRIVDFINDETPEPGVEYETIDFRVLGEGLATQDFHMASMIQSQRCRRTHAEQRCRLGQRRLRHAGRPPVRLGRIDVVSVPGDG